MEGRLTRLYERLGPKYLLLFPIGGAVIGNFTGGLCVAAAIPYLDASFAEMTRLLLATSGAAMVALALALRFGARDLARPLLAWTRGERTEDVAIAVWQAGVAGLLPLMAKGIVVFSLVNLPLELYAPLELDLPSYTVLIVFGAVEVVILVAAMLDYFGAEQLLRPILREVAEHLPADYQPDYRAPPLRTKLIATISLISLYTAALASATGTTSVSPQAKLALGLGIALCVTLTISLLMASLLTASVVTPVGELIAATRRVEAGDLRTRVPLMGGDEHGLLARSFNRMMKGLEERAALHSAMGSYLDPQIAERVLAEGELLEGEEVEVSVLFVDIRNFTAFAETRPAKETVSHLNGFFGHVVPVVSKHGGHANKFLGDGLLAVFGAPDRRRDHSDRAVAAACEIVQVVDEFYGDELRIGIGISSGTVVAGSIGGGGRLEFTLIGDPVNVAARVQELTKKTQDSVLITEATRVQLSSPLHAVQDRGTMRLRGRAAEVLLYAVQPDDAPGVLSE